MAKLTLSDLANLTNENTAVTAINANSALIETALENTLSRDGTTPNTMSADLDMNSKRILNLPPPVYDTEPVRLGEFNDAVVDAINGAGAVTNVTSVSGGELTVFSGATGQVITKSVGTGIVKATAGIPSYSATLAVADGGTAATTASAARTSLGVAVGTDVQAFDATLTALAAYSTDGLVTHTGVDTFTGRTITGTTNQLTVTNGNGVSGNPTLTIASLPAFSVNNNNVDVQTGLADNSVNTVSWSTEAYDTGSFFATNAWTPPSGLIVLNAGVRLTSTLATTTSKLSLMIYKNGSLYKETFFYPSWTTELSGVITAQDRCNGTDAYTLVIQCDTNAATYTIKGTTSDTFFQGHWVCP